MAGERILIVEDEPRIAEVLERYLRHAGFATERAADGARALELWRAADPDLIVLDLMIPAPDGLEVARHVRERSDVPIVMVTAKAEEADRLAGLGVGADDYVVKPFSPREVVARVTAVLRRSSGRVRSPTHHVAGDLAVDVGAAQARCAGEPLALSPAQFRLLAVLVARAGEALSREELLDALEGSWADERTVDAHVKNLRHRLGRCRDRLETVRGFGYRVRP
jgi:two-component system response regulator BaeR/two-component system response regulator AdeR